VLQAAGGLLALLLIAVIALIVGTSYRSFGPRFVSLGVPSWTAPCRRLERDVNRLAVYRCAQVDGRVIWRSGVHADGHKHLVVVAGLHLVVVELDPRTPSPPLLGRIKATGLVQSRAGPDEIVDAAIDH
jgi:hypothetical protein